MNHVCFIIIIIFFVYSFFCSLSLFFIFYILIYYLTFLIVFSQSINFMGLNLDNVKLSFLLVGLRYHVRLFASNKILSWDVTSFNKDVHKFQYHNTCCVRILYYQNDLQQLRKNTHWNKHAHSINRDKYTSLSHIRYN